MSKKLLTKVLAIATGAILFAGMFATGVGAPAKQAAAAASAVDATVKTALKGCFDADFYANQYADVKAALGTNANTLFSHFINNGIHEGRMVNANFDPKAYIKAYPDVATYCNGDYCKAYEHYVKYGMAEGRALTTFAKLGAQAAPAPASSSSGSGSTADDKKKVDIGYGITVSLTKEQMNSNHIEIVESEYGYGAFLVSNGDEEVKQWLGGTKFYFPFEGGVTVQEIALSDNPAFVGNDVAQDYLPVWGTATHVTSSVSNGIPSIMNPWAEADNIDVWGNDDTRYNVRVGFGDYNQFYAESAVEVFSPQTWFYQETQSENWDFPGAFVY